MKLRIRLVEPFCAATVRVTDVPDMGTIVVYYPPATGVGRRIATDDRDRADAAAQVRLLLGRPRSTDVVFVDVLGTALHT